MTEGSMKGVEKEEYVEVVHDYSYHREGRTLHMTKGETLMLLKRSTNDWWQVIRQGEQRPFFAPTQYIRVTTVPVDQMKHYIKQGWGHQKATLTEGSSPGKKPGAVSLSKDSSSSSLAESPTSTNPSASQSYMAKIEPGRLQRERSDSLEPGSLGRLQRERSDSLQNRPGGLSSFKIDSPRVPPRGLPLGPPPSELSSPNAHSKFFSPSGQESSSSHTSKSSLNDGSRCSMESLSQLHMRKQAIKAASHDELMYGERSCSVLDVSQPKAASSEELDARYYGRDYLFKSNQLSYRHRSNSVDFRIFQKELTFCELKQGSLDKSRKPRLSRDPGNRRRSWAVEEVRVPENYRSSYKRAETQDAAIVLDVPPKLPPKQRKHKHDPFGSSSENLGRLEGPIDVKLQEVKLIKPALPLTGPNVKRLSQDYDRGSSRQISDPHESQNKPSIRRQEAVEISEVPVALPRKLLPPQVSSLERKVEDQDTQKLSIPGKSPPDVSEARDITSIKGNDKKISEFRHRLEPSPSSVKIETISIDVKKKIGSPKMHDPHDRIERTSSFKRNGNTRLSSKKIGTPEMTRRGFGTPELSRKIYEGGTPDSVRKAYSLPLGRGSAVKDLSGSLVKQRKQNDVLEEEEKENEMVEKATRDVYTPDPLWTGKSTMPCPPSPQTPPKRIVFDDWGEYIDETTGRFFYYNSRSKEKRWKPPRKGIHSVAIPEVPHHARFDVREGSLGRGQLRTPPVDHSASPTTSHHHKLWSYGSLPEGGGGTLSTSPSPSHHHYPQTRSQTLPIFPHTMRNPHYTNTPPLLPPCSAKPNVPSTPTTPSFIEFPEVTEAHHNSALLDTLYNLSLPRGWEKRYDALTQRVYFRNLVTGEKVRKSMFISHDEEDSMMETKPLTGDSPMVTTGLYPPSPRCISPDVGSGTYSDREDSTFSDDLEGSTSTLPCLGIGSDYYTKMKDSLDSDKWFATSNDEGKIYFYDEHVTKSQWTLPEQSDYVKDSNEDGKDCHLISTLESQRISLVTENLADLRENIKKEGFLRRTFLWKDGKKVRKNWTNSYARYIVGSFNSGSLGLIHFSKSKDDDKKAEIFDLAPPCSLDCSNDKKTSRQQVLGLHNGHNTEILLQFEDRDIADEWLRALTEHEGMQISPSPGTEKDDKKSKKISEKMKRSASVEQLNPDNKGITDKLRNFIKKRPLKETLEKKGIYKEAVFGSTLAELNLQEKTTIPTFVKECIDQIEKTSENLNTDGLYRISGNAAQIQKIRYEVGQQKYLILTKEKDVHNLSGSLKLFFRELKEPLIPFANYRSFIEATGSEYRKKNQQVDKLTKAVHNLPVENYDTLKFLLQHLLRVSKHESQNRMGISNLAIVFGPCLLCPKETNSQDLMTDVMLHNRIIEGLLADFSKIYKK